MSDTPASRVEEARRDLETFVRQMVDDDGALAIKDANGRGLTHFADAFAAAVRAEERAKADRELTALGNGLTDATALLLKDERAAVRSDVLAQVRERIAELHWHYADGRETGMITARDLYAALSDLAEGKS